MVTFNYEFINIGDIKRILIFENNNIINLEI